MDTVKVNKEDLLATLEENRVKHVADYKEAMTEYRKAAVIEVTAMLKQAKSKSEPITRAIKAPEPVSYEKSYATAIRMLTMSVDDVIELGEHEFKQYVEDEWTWQASFTSNTLMYKNSR